MVGMAAAAGPLSAGPEPAPAPADAAPEPRRAFSLDPRDWPPAWTDAKRDLSAAGLNVSIFLNDQYAGVLKGGLDTNGSGRNSLTYDIFLTFDLGRLAALPDAEILAHLQANHGHGVNLRTGALMQVYDDADGHDAFHVAQLWFRQHTGDRRAALQVGFLDFQTIVDRNAYANSEDKQFMNQALDNNPMVPLAIGLGAALTVKPVPWWTVIIGAGDADSQLYKPGFSTAFHDEARFVGFFENGFSYGLPSPRGRLAGNLRLGAFYDPRVRDQFVRKDDDPRRRSGRPGVYASVDQMVYREGPDDEQGLGVFGRFGYRDPETFTTSRFWSCGLVYRGLLPGREQDELGFGYALLRSSHLYRDRVNDRWENESIYELYYAVQVSPWLTITPDFQYIDNPGAGGETGHAIVAGIRARLSL
jgi:porin